MIESLSYFGELLTGPFNYIANPQKRIFWLYLLSNGLIAFAILYGRKHSIFEILRAGFSTRTWFNSSSLLDLQWIFLNHVINRILIIPLLGGQIAFALGVNRILSLHFGEGNFIHWHGLSVSVCFTLCLFLCDDFSRFYVHYLYHKIPQLWRFHAIHHSAESLTPLTLYRIHSVEMLLNSMRSLVVTGTLSGIFIYCFDGAIDTIQILGASLFNFLFNMAGANLRHSSVWLGFGRLENFFISPAQHQIHHSARARHLDKNFGAILAIWDRWFGSWLASEGQQINSFGLVHRKVEQHLGKQLFGLSNNH
ncbi:MAG TPA: sterol desaturase family protein [Gammaproteobacteria bacterium]|nr:sterol desaturase family protein [Gammaproteobacteria bacterium]